MPYQAITRAELRSRLQEFWESKPFWTADEANRAINEALRFWNLLTGRWQDTMTLTTTVNTSSYALPSSILYRTRVAWNGLPLSSDSRESFENGRPRWRAETMTSGGDVPTRPTLWAPISLRQIAIWPHDLGHQSLEIDGVAATPVLGADGAFVNLSEADVSVLLGYGLHVVSLKKGGPYFAQTFKYFRAMLAAAGEENSLLTTSQVYRRVMGLDHRDQKPLRGAPSSIAQLAARASEAP